MSEKSSEVEPQEKSSPTNSGNKGFSGSILPGLLLIFIGFVFLLTNLTGFRLDNWWAVFILIPAFNNFSTGLAKYRDRGVLDQAVRGSLFSALFFVLLSIAFLIDLDFGVIWPVFIILAGLGILVRAF